MPVSKRAIAAYLDREFDDWRWMKSLSHRQLDEELARLRPRPVFKTEPWLHQKVSFLLGATMPRFLFLLVMGAGKTKIMADLMTHYLRSGRMERALVTVPRKLNTDSWEDDLAVHSDLECWPVSVANIEGKRELLLNPKGDVTVIDYPSLHLALSRKVPGKKGNVLEWHPRWVKYARQLYDFIGIDEVHKLASHDTLWFQIMRQLTQEAEHVYGTTGTLFGKHVDNLWAPYYLVDGGETFGETLGIMRAAMFEQEKMPKRGWKFIKRNTHQLQRMIGHRSISYTEDEAGLDLPRMVPRVSVCHMAEEQREHYMNAIQGIIDAGGNKFQIDAQWLRLRQIIAGYLAWEDEYGKHVLPFKHNPKLDDMERLLDEMDDSKVIVCHDYVQTGELICKRLKSLHIGHEWIYGGTKDQSAAKARFERDPDCRVLVMNSETGGTGNDGLQRVARYMLFYEAPTPPITRAQTEKRIHRPGQRHRTFAYDLVMAHSLDKTILERCKAGIDAHAEIINARVKKSFFLGE